MSNTPQDTESYRDQIATVNDRGGRIWVYPKKPKGKFYQWRTYLSWGLLALLFGMPFIKVNGDPLLLFNVLEGKFIVFGLVFMPQDLHLFALAMITFVVFIVLFTVVFGRLFCGWICPQTIFMEMVFRKIEYWIEGDYTAQKRLNKAPWNSDKAIKKVSKHLIFFLIAVLIANTFLAYIIGIDQVYNIISEPISLHLGGFVSMLVFSGLFYWVFAFFREQVCIAVCPYGRLQGVLLVKESIVVIYDWIRGEPRGKMKKKADTFKALPVVENPAALGDCIDCHLCVKVCPTGIDIRNGTQLECVNCTACMDACDEVMIKVGREPGLIRYDSPTNIEAKQKKIFTTRVWAYTAALGILIVLQGFLFMTRSEVETLFLRTPGLLFQKTEDGNISNLYNYQLTNKTTETISNVEFKLVNKNGRIKVVGKVPDIEKQDQAKGSLFIEISPDDLSSRKNKLKIEVYSNGKLIDEVKTNFLGPVK